MTNLIPTEDQERQAKAFVEATADVSRVLVQRKRRTGLAVQFHEEHVERLTAGGLELELHPDPNAGSVPGYVGASQWALFGVSIDPGDYIVNVSGEGIRVVTREEFENEWEVVGDA